MKKCINKKRISSAIAALLVLFFALGILGIVFSKKDGFYLKNYENADAKFYENYILTSVDEGMRLLDFKGKTLKTYDGVNASWLYVYEPERLVVYSNHEMETHLMKLDEDENLLWDRVILRSSLLAIDPTICKFEDTYLLTHTTIDGTINNPSPDGENGVYTLELYASKDLQQWEHRTTVISEKHDIEDIDMICDGGKIYCIYEKEDYDKGPSKICMKVSDDAGESWSEEQLLIENGGDNEFSCIMKENGGWRIYYSSDKECIGQSYNGASAYSAFFDTEFIHQPEKDRKEPVRDNQGVRLYEVREYDGKLYFMFAHNYLTDKDFVLRRIDRNKE